jgi:hypothetical protein
VNLPPNLAPGTYYVGGIADYNNQIIESKESNNNYNVVQITVGAHAQLSGTTMAAAGNDNFSFVPELGGSSLSSPLPHTSAVPAAPEMTASQDLASAIAAMAVETQHFQLEPGSHDASSQVASLGSLPSADVHASQTAHGFIIH